MLKLKMLGDNVLREHTEKIDKIDDLLIKQIKEMTKIMTDESGVGLAGPQVGLLKKLIVMLDKKDSDDDGKLLVLINPEKKKVSKDLIELEEGCLSVQGPNGPVYAFVTRPESVEVEYTNINGEKISHSFSGLAARIVQHEMDHLDGVLFIDYLPAVKRTMINNKVKKRESCIKQKD